VGNGISFRRFRARILTLRRGVKQLLMILAGVAAYAIAVAVSLWEVSGFVASQSWIIYLAAGCIAVSVFWLFGLYTSIIRYVGIELLRTGYR
jgi:FlaA1/EpsC-like NDP-sugar epimerase